MLNAQIPKVAVFLVTGKYISFLASKFFSSEVYHFPNPAANSVIYAGFDRKISELYAFAMVNRKF